MKSSSLIGGSIHAATAEGFRRMIAEVNRASREGHDLITVVPLGDQIGCVYRRREDATDAATARHDSFFD